MDTFLSPINEIDVRDETLYVDVKRWYFNRKFNVLYNP